MKGGGVRFRGRAGGGVKVRERGGVRIRGREGGGVKGGA